MICGGIARQSAGYDRHSRDIPYRLEGYRGYYMAAREYEFYLRVLLEILSLLRAIKILFLGKRKKSWYVISIYIINRDLASNIVYLKR